MKSTADLFLVAAIAILGLLLQSEVSYGATECGVNGLQCPSNQVCQVVPDPSCTTQPCPQVAQCFPQVACTLLCIVGYHCVIDYLTNPPEPKCVPTNPCDNVACPQFQQCYVESSNCSADPNQPQPVCAYSNPCEFVNCPNGTICARTQEGNTPPTAQCVRQTDPCSGVQCPDLQKCFLRDSHCVEVLCDPVPECAYYDPCMVTRCATHYFCKVQQNGNNPPTAQCILDLESLCADTICPVLQQCYMRPLDYYRPSIFPPQSVCDYSDPCMLARCPDGLKCLTVNRVLDILAPTATCVPDADSICNSTVCPQGQKCYLQNVTCVKAPCMPVPTCNNTDPCSVTECATGFTCVVKDNGDYAPTAQCVFEPSTICLTHECPPYQQCYLTDVVCVTQPCAPQPVCSYPDPCLFVYCAEGYNCVVVDQVPKPPTAYCLQNYDVCVGVNCTSGYSCYVKDMECTDFECYPVPPTAVCSLADPCTTKQCPANSNCVTVQQPRKNPPLAKCLPQTSPCDNLICQSNELCYIRDYYCNQTGCYDIAAVGVCALPDPCTAAKCTQNTTCQVVQIRRNPPQALCGPVKQYNPCDNFTCGSGFECFVKDVDCPEFTCNAIVPQPVCSVLNACSTATCPEGIGCVSVQIRNNPPQAQCKAVQYLCDSLKCGTNELCYVQDYQCNLLGCSRLTNPYPTCAPSNPCNATTCAFGTVCYNEQVRNNPPKPVCVATPYVDSCLFVRLYCALFGQSCYVADVNCDDISCTSIAPYAMCATSNPCSTVLCAADTTCVVTQKRRNPPQAVCKPLNPCDSIICSAGQQCYVQDYQCNSTDCTFVQPKGVCDYPDPCAFTLCQTGSICLTQQIRNNPPFALCSPISNPCESVLLPCPLGQVCFVKDFDCDKYSCRLISPTPVCAAADPCYQTTCPDTSVCLPSQIRSNPPQSYCASSKEICNGVQCPQGEKCYIVQVFCIRAPCPPQPMCAPVDPCATVTCLPGYTCVNRQYGVSAPFPDCVRLDDPCDGVNCSDGQQCFLRERPCRCPPCGYGAVCSYPNPCILALCPQGYGCYPKLVGRLEPVPVCYPSDNPCPAYDCIPGQECSLTEIACQEFLPCPEPVCSGDPTQYLCNLAKCGPGYECVVDMDFKPLVAKCVPYKDPCGYTICPNGSSCVVLMMYPPVGRCQNVTVTNPCSVVRCKPGYVCVETATAPVQAQCVPTCAICPLTTNCIVIDTNPPNIFCTANPKWLITYSKA